VGQDVTDLKQAEARLQHRTDLSSAALAASRIAIFRWDLHTGEWEWDRTEPVIGLIPETTLRSLEGVLSRVVPEDRAELFERLTRSAKEGTPFEHEFRIISPPEGATIWVCARGRVRRDQGGQPASMTGAFVNMTHYRLLLREVQDCQELLLLAESAAGLHSWAVNTTRDRKMWWSPSSYRLYGRKEELGVPTEEEFLNMVHPEDREQVRKVSQLLEKGGSDDNFKIEFRTIPISGRVRWILSMGRVHRDAGGWPLQLVGVGIDITQRREAEEALRRVEKLSALDRLATRIAHDINNPLMAVWNSLYLITKSSRLEDAQHYALRAQEELARITHSTNILRFRRRSTPLKQQRVSAIMGGVLDMQERRRPNVEVIRDFRDSTPLDSSRDDLEQLFAILLRNAFDAVGGGGLVEVRVVERPNPNTGESGIHVVVADTGKGMSSEVKSRLFEPFFSTKDWLGLGLGLWIASGIVEQHEGRIKIRSSQAQAHHGTVVSVFLPFRSALGSEVTFAAPNAA
jgi:PAS domain S-box-containing protein